MKLKEGISLHVLPTNKFKTLSIQFRFKEPLQADVITKRALLASLMDTNSKHYPTQLAFRKRLSELYGADFYTDVSRYGSYHVISLNMDIVNGNIINEEGMFDDAMEFLHQVIFCPNTFNGKFHEATFIREAEKLADDILSRDEDKQLYADDQLNSLYFDTEEQKMLAYGRVSDLKDITPYTLYESYLTMLNDNQIDIYVTGEITETRVLRALNKFYLKPRQLKALNPFYRRTQSTSYNKLVEKQDINQTILTMGLETPIYYHNDYYYAGLVFDGLFGSMPHSKLFQTVREEENLAYSVSSDIDVFRGMMTIEAGIESFDLDKTKALILEQLQEIKKGHFSEKDLAQTKEVLKSERHQLSDSPYAMIEYHYSLLLAQQDNVSMREWQDKIDNVSKKEVIRLADLIYPRAEFILIGEKL